MTARHYRLRADGTREETTPCPELEPVTFGRAPDGVDAVAAAERLLRGK